MQLSCFFTLKRSYQSIKHESQFGQEGEAQSNAPATSARPPPRPASPVASPPAAVKGEATSLLCCSVLSCLITRLHFLVLKGSARTQALAALSPASPLGRGAGDGFRGPHGQAHLVPPGNPPSCVRATTGGEFGHCLAAGRLARPPLLCSPRLLIGTVAPPPSPPPLRCQTRGGGGPDAMFPASSRTARRVCAQTGAFLLVPGNFLGSAFPEVGLLD